MSRPRDPRVALSIGVAAVLILIGFFSFGHAPPSPASVWKHGFHQGHQEKLAFATWLGSTLAQDEKQEMDDDVYFIATRLLVWQLLHHESTKAKGIDVVVLVTPDVDQARRDRLAQDGAIVRPIDFLHGKDDSWFHQDIHRWTEVMSKLRAWEMTEYDRVVLLDSDIILQRPLDGIFDDPAAQPIKALTHIKNPDDEPPLPETFLFSSLPETHSKDHSFPPTAEKGLSTPHKVNAGLIMLAPNQQMFQYYAALLDIPHRFELGLPEQDLLNYAHRLDGPIPWRNVSLTWNIRYANDNDMNQGVASMHDKWWKDAASKRVKAFYMSMRWQMEEFYTARDEAKKFSARDIVTPDKPRIRGQSLEAARAW